MAKFSKQHYVEIANTMLRVEQALNGGGMRDSQHLAPLNGWHAATCGLLALMFKRDSSLFDPIKFLKACGLDNYKIEQALENLKHNRDWTDDWRTTK